MQFIFFTLVSFLLLIPGHIFASPIHPYQRIQNETTHNLKWVEKKIGPHKIHYTDFGKDEIQTYVFEHNKTVLWTKKKRSGPLLVGARLNGRTLNLTQMVNGLPKKTSFSIHKKPPWVQAPRFFVETFFDSGKKKFAFVVISDTLKLKTLFLIRGKNKNRTIGNHTVREITPIYLKAKGTPRMIWSGEYQVDTQTGQLLGYKGPSAGLGSPKKVEQY